MADLQSAALATWPRRPGTPIERVVDLRGKVENPGGAVKPRNGTFFNDSLGKSAALIPITHRQLSTIIPATRLKTALRTLRRHVPHFCSKDRSGQQSMLFLRRIIQYLGQGWLGSGAPLSGESPDVMDVKLAGTPPRQVHG